MHSKHFGRPCLPAGGPDAGGPGLTLSTGFFLGCAKPQELSSPDYKPKLG